METRPYDEIPFVDGGRDFDGADCWGFCVLVARHTFGIELPEWPHAGLTDGSIDLSIAQNSVDSRRDQFVKVDNPQCGDLVLLLPRHMPVHLGIIVQKLPLKFYHTERKSGPVCERLYGIAWQGRIEGIYRYRGQALSHVS